MANAKLLTLSEVSRRTKISMPTLQRYKKEFQDRIPSEGEGRKQRYPIKALEVFKAIKKENVGKRGRPRKAAAAAKPKAPKASRRGRRTTAAKSQAAPAKAETLMTLTQASKETGISYPTLVRYTKVFASQIPHEGTGRKRRYPAAALDVFRKLRSESDSRRGRRGPQKAKAAPAKRKAAPRKAAAASEGDLVKRIQALESSQASLEKQVRALIKQNMKPLKVTIQRV
ncbi:MAG: MerR family transcriptional regulator [Acidobacteriota bacterium]